MTTETCTTRMWSQEELRDELLSRIDEKSDVICAYKFAPVNVRRAIQGERILTLLNGYEEAEVICKEGDLVITNPGGEEYVITEETFQSNYMPEEGMPGVAYPRSDIRKFIKIPEELLPMHIMAPWGNVQKMEHGYLNIDNITAMYLIEEKAFHETYIMVS